jgi:hypothetical protein
MLRRVFRAAEKEAQDLAGGAVAASEPEVLDLIS